MIRHDYQREEARQQQAVEQRINECDRDSPDECRRLTEDIAQLAHERFFRFRFGSFAGEGACVVYANMAPANLANRDAFRRRLTELGVPELGVAVWPEEGHPDAGYSWAVLVGDPDAEGWEQVAREAWIRQG